MEVDAHVYYWTSAGMRPGEPAPGHNGYIERHEVELLLEQAYARGRREGRSAAEAG